MFPARLELATFRVLGGRDNHYTTKNKKLKHALKLRKLLSCRASFPYRFAKSAEL